MQPTTIRKPVYKIKRKPKVEMISILDIIMTDWDETVSGLVEKPQPNDLRRRLWAIRRE